jgi:hypothetical protein
MLGWWGRLHFCVYNHGKITKYGTLVQTVCDSKSSYICNMHVYDGKSGPLTETVSLLLQPCEGKGYHVHQDNCYNSVCLAKELLQKSIQVCGTIRAKCGLPKDMVQEPKMLKKGEVTFCRKQDVLLVSHHDKRLVNMISILHTAAVT